MNRIFDVKQAAQILGVSTNTMYKYLNEGRITAARGHQKGTFKIPVKSLESFLGTKLTADQLSAVEKPIENTQKTPERVLINVTPPSLSIKVMRGILIASLILIILDIIFSSNFSFGTQVARLSIVFLFIIMTYQFGGFVKK